VEYEHMGKRGGGNKKIPHFETIRGKEKAIQHSPIN